MCGEGKDPSLGATRPDSHFISVSVRIQRAWRQAGEALPLHILDALLQRLAINRLSMMLF
jgi:hypothetical protein